MRLGGGVLNTEGGMTREEGGILLLSVTSRFLRLHNSGEKGFAGAFGACKSLITPVPRRPGGTFAPDGGGGGTCVPPTRLRPC